MTVSAADGFNSIISLIQISPGGCSHGLHQLYSYPSWLLWPRVHLCCCFSFYCLLPFKLRLEPLSISPFSPLCPHKISLQWFQLFLQVSERHSFLRALKWSPHSGQPLPLEATWPLPPTGQPCVRGKDSFYDRAVVWPRHAGLRSLRPSPQGGRWPCQPPTYLLSSAANPFCVYHALWHH